MSKLWRVYPIDLTSREGNVSLAMTVGFFSGGVLLGKSVLKAATEKLHLHESHSRCLSPFPVQGWVIH